MRNFNGRDRTLSAGNRIIQMSEEIHGCGQEGWGPLGRDHVFRNELRSAPGEDMKTKTKNSKEYIQCVGMFVQEGQVKVVQEVMEVCKQTKKHYQVLNGEQQLENIRHQLIGAIRECTNDESPAVEAYLKGKELSAETQQALKAALMNAVNRRASADLLAVENFNQW